MEERTILFKPYNGKEEIICVSTNAPKKEIKKALQFRNEVVCTDEFMHFCDFEIIQYYLEEKGYNFYALDTREVYYW